MMKLVEGGPQPIGGAEPFNFGYVHSRIKRAIGARFPVLSDSIAASSAALSSITTPSRRTATAAGRA